MSDEGFKATTEIRQEVSQKFDNCDVVSEGEAIFCNGYLQRVVIQHKGSKDNAVIFVSGVKAIGDLKQVRDFLNKLIEFAEGQKEKIDQKIEEGRMRRIEL